MIPQKKNKCFNEFILIKMNYTENQLNTIKVVRYYLSEILWNNSEIHCLRHKFIVFQYSAINAWVTFI